MKINRAMAHLEGIDIFYRDTGSKGTPILCLHGRWGRGETWVDFMMRYGERYRVIAPDLRGHGLSGRPRSRYDAAEFAADMAALLDSLGLDSAIIVGHSMGGHAAAHLAANFPRRAAALAILDKSAGGPELAPPGPGEPELDPLTKGWPLPFSSLVEAKEHIRRIAESELSYEYFMSSLIETVEGYGMMFAPYAIAANIAHYAAWYELLPRLRCPVMLLRAKGNDAVSDEDFSRMRESIPNCRAYEVSNPDHNVHLGNKEEFYAHFDDFLDRIGR